MYLGDTARVEFFRMIVNTGDIGIAKFLAKLDSLQIRELFLGLLNEESTVIK